MKKSRKLRKLKLYVWEDVLSDYSSGLAVALAHSVEEARRLIVEKIGAFKEEFLVEPKIVESPRAFFVFGQS